MAKPQYRTTRRVPVKLDGRDFFGHYDGDKLIAIKERRMYAPGEPWQSFYDAPIWHHSHGGKHKNRKGGLTHRLMDALGET